MPIKPAPRCGNKRLELLARKEKILNSLKYYEQRIKAESLVDASVVCYDESSDSDCDLLPVISNGPSIQELKSQEAMLQVCLNATCELACLELLQYELSHTSADPNIQGEPPVTKPGSWREVTAECRIDLVPFSITFYVHQADGPFGAKSFRGLQVLVVKKAHETELAQSILPQAKCPSDAVEVLRNYASAYRSRRSTLAHLADKYDGKLYMELLPEGGCKLKCGNLLELSWVLENKKSPLTPFHHRMMFDLEYMDETYIKLIKQAHKQLSDPTIDTRDRTLLLAKIIDTCLEAEGAHESIDSETESVKKLEKRRITLETEAPVAKKSKNKNADENLDENEQEIHENDTEMNENVNVANDTTKKKDHANSNNDEHIMAPPKSLPKKFKPKGKENMDHNKKPVKRSTIEENNASAKKAKTVPNNKEQNENDQNLVKNDTKKKEIDKINDQSKNAVTNDTKKKEIDKINDQSKKKVTKPQNDKDKVQRTQNNVEKETEKASEKEKVVKSKSVEVKSNTNSGNKKVNSNNVQKTIEQDVNVKKVQDNLKKQVSKEQESQKVVDKGKVVSKTKKSVTEKIVNEEVNDPKNVEPKSKPTIQVTKVASNKAITSKNLNKNENPGLGNEKEKSGESKTNKGKGPNQNNYQSKTKGIEKVASTENLKTTDKHQENNEVETKNPKNGNSEEIISKNRKVLKVVNTKKISPKDNIPKNDNTTENVKNTKSIKTNNSNTANNQNLPENNSKNNNIAKVDNPTKNIRKTFTLNDANSNSNSKNIVSNTARNNKIGTKKPQDIQNVSTNLTKESETQKVVNEDKSTNKLKSKITTNKLSPFNSKKIISSTPKKVVDRETAVKLFNIKTTTNKNIINTKLASDKPKSVVNPKKMLISNLSHKNPGLKNKLTKISTMKAVKSTNNGSFKPGNSSNDSNGSKVSKIPKKLAIPENVTRNSLRLSPRRLPSAFKSISDSSIKQNLSNIPRLMRKP